MYTGKLLSQYNNMIFKLLYDNQICAFTAKAQKGMMI
jgi:hypothetical protein